MSSQPSILPIAEATARKPDSIRVFLRDCKTELRVGIYESEMQAPQQVMVNVEIESQLPHHYQDLNEKKLDRVIDYAPVYHFVCEQLPAIGHIYLLETVA